MHNDSLILPIVTLMMNVVRKNYENASIIPRMNFSATVDGKPVQKGVFSVWNTPSEQYFVINAVFMEHINSKWK